MTPGTFRKVKASMMIVMLSVAEAHRIQASSSDRGTSQSDGAAQLMADPPSKKQVKLAAKQLAAQIVGPKRQEQAVEQMKVDPKLQEQLKAVTAAASLQEQAKQVQEQMEVVKPELLSFAKTSRSNWQECNKTVGRPWKAEQALLPEVTLIAQMDAIITDPGFRKQRTFLAEQVESMMADPNVRGQAALIADQMDAMLAEPSSVNHSTRVSELMEAMINDPKFQEWAMRVAEQMGETIMRDSRFLEFSKVASAQMDAMKTGPNPNEETTLVQMMNAVSDPNFQEQVTQVSQRVELLIGNPTLLQQAVSLAEQIEAMKDGSDNMEEATQVVKHVDVLMADSTLQAQAELVAEEMVAMMEHSSSSVQTNLSLEQMEAMKTEPLAFVELNRSSGQESAKARILPFTLDARNVRQLSRGPPFPLEDPMLASGVDKVDFGNQRIWNPLTLALERKRGRGPWMSMIDTAAHTPKQGMSHAGPATNTHSSGLTSAKGLKMLMPTLINALPYRNPGPVMSAPSRNKTFSGDASVLLVFTIWFVATFCYNINNKLLTKATGAAFPMTIATLQLGVSLIYSLVLWMTPNGRQRPNISFKDYIATLPLGAAFASVHLAAVFSMTLGAISFGNIVRSAEPAFAAVIGTYLYGAKISTARWFTLVPVIGGIILASLGEVNFAMGALVTASLANVFNAIRGNEIEKLLGGDPGLSKRIGGAGNLYSIMSITSFFFVLPLMLLTEGKTFGQFLTLITANPSVLNTFVTASFAFTILNEFGVKSVKMMGTVSAAVARTASRVVFIIGSGLILKEGLGPVKLFGAGISISGAFLYNIIDNLLKDREQKWIANPPPTLPQTENTAFTADKPNQRGVRTLLRKLRQR